MFTRLINMLFVLFAVMILLLGEPLLASDLSQLIIKAPDKLTPLTNDNANSLPPQYASDHQGNAIIIPTEQRSALEYRAKDSDLKPSQQARTTTKTPRASTTASTTIANDPNCRWLNNRLTHLQKKLRQTQNNQFSHYQDEIDIRETEWTCLKCASTGPSHVDRNACQAKR